MAGPSRNGGFSMPPSQPTWPAPHPTPQQTWPTQQTAPQPTWSPPQPITRQSWTAPPPSIPQQTRPVHHPKARETPEKGWTCAVCTLHNPAQVLCCEACLTSRPEDPSRKAARERAAVLARGPSRRPPPDDFAPVPPPGPPPPQTWNCSFCGTTMERQWWACSTCGVMKDNSR